MAHPMSEDAITQAHLEASAVAAYVDGALSRPAAASVEAHLAQCAACRAEVVQITRAVRPRRGRRRSYVVASVAAAAAVLLIAWPPTPLPRADGGDDLLAAQLRELGRVAQAPIYLGASVRSSSAQGPQRFASGMRAYTSAQYAEAIAELGAARAAGIDGPAARFFLATSQLMLGDASGAATEFARVAAMGETPYLAEAHYYRAKALLRLAQFNDAELELGKAAAAGNESMQVIAAALRDSVRALRAR